VDQRHDLLAVRGDPHGRDIAGEALVVEARHPELIRVNFPVVVYQRSSLLDEAKLRPQTGEVVAGPWKYIVR
jgi:hypothetical protein